MKVSGTLTEEQRASIASAVMCIIFIFDVFKL